MKRKIGLGVIVVSIAMLVTGMAWADCEHAHQDWSFILYPTCKKLGLQVSPCVHCNMLSVRPVNVVPCEYLPATCTEPQTCQWCGDTRGKPNGHVFDASGFLCTDCGYKDAPIYDVCLFLDAICYISEEKVWLRAKSGEQAGVILVDLADYADQLGDHNWRHVRLVCSGGKLYLLSPHDGVLYKVKGHGTLEKTVELSIPGLSNQENSVYPSIHDLMIIDNVLYMSMTTSGDGIDVSDHVDVHLYAFSLEDGQRKIVQ